ncbi:MAG: flagellar hook-associated protein FlgK [Bacteroidetes bacterium]|nr:MAG: flagellar hook-associated protein FlgK [Bacteroidota bacterium]
MSSFSSLEIGKRGLLAQRLGLDVTSNNIANVNTPGYARRQAVLTETTPQKIMAGFIGTGVLVENIRSYREEFFDREIRKNMYQQAGYELDETVFQRIESIISEPSDMGLNEAVNNFFNAFEQVSVNPEDVAGRQYLLDTAQTMVDRFHTISGRLTDLKNEVKSKFSQDVEKANQLIKDIADLNQKVYSTYSLPGGDAQTYIDQRELKLEELSQIAGISVTQSDLGSVNVFINGKNIINQDTYYTLKLNEQTSPLTGTTIQLEAVDPQGNSQFVFPPGGELASLAKHFNTTLNEMSSGFSIMKNLNDYADAIVTNVNLEMNSGYGLDDTTAPPPGRDFFDASGLTAATINISTDVANPRDIPLSSAPGEPGNGNIALNIAGMTATQNFISDYVDLIGKIGQMGKDASNGKNTTKLVADQLSNQRESVIGVNLDEEAVNLIKFQKAFEASSRVVNLANDILGTIINLGK